MLIPNHAVSMQVVRSASRYVGFIAHKRRHYCAKFYQLGLWCFTQGSAVLLLLAHACIFMHKLFVHVIIINLGRVVRALPPVNQYLYSPGRTGSNKKQT